MTVWLLHQPLTPEEEAHIGQSDTLPLPFGGLPDLSNLRSREQCRKLLLSLDPDAPPETLARRADEVWRRYGGLKREDIIAVPLPSRRELALAEISEPYRYDEEKAAHVMQVRWHRKRVPQRALRHHRAFIAGSEPLVEVQDADLRTAIRDRLPHAYNRFTGWKWLLVLFFALNIVRIMLSHDRAWP